MKKPRHQQQHTPSPEPEAVIAIVPVKISIMHAETILTEYDDDITIDFTPTTREGRRHLQVVLHLTVEEGYATEEALFTLASRLVYEHAEQFIASLTMTAFTLACPHELHLHVKRTGAISSAKSIAK